MVVVGALYSAVRVVATFQPPPARKGGAGGVQAGVPKCTLSRSKATLSMDKITGSFNEAKKLAGSPKAAGSIASALVTSERYLCIIRAHRSTTTSPMPRQGGTFISLLASAADWVG
eukprot:1141305-Pelagomonas_calceolata.AAC.3